MVPQTTNHAPERKTRRERRIEILEERRRIKNILKKLRPVTFDNDTVTEAGNFQFLARFKELIGLDALIESHFHLEQKANCVYPAGKLVDQLLDCALLGHTRFQHMNALQSDPGYQIVTGIDRFPDESTFRGFLNKLSWSHLIQLVALNRDLLANKAQTGEKRLVWIDIDDTVITLFGEQEGATNGYNPRYHGRPSYKIRVAFIAGSGELLHLQLNPGNTNGMKDLLSFVKEVEAMLPPEWIVEGIRADCGFADAAVMEYAEQRGWQYIFKLPKIATVKKAIAYLQQHPAFWETLAEKQEDITFATEDHRWAAADIPILLTNWEQARRCVIYREAHETERTTDDQLTLTLTTYSFQAIVTNVDLKPLPLLRSYNKRANIENRIDELKEGYAVEQNSQHSMLRNLLFSWIKAIAYNLMVWFKQTLMPESMQQCEVQTIRRAVIRVPGNVVGSGRYQHVRLAPNPGLAVIVRTMHQKFIALAERFRPSIQTA
ncbi:IS1380 family transposase [Paenibacillus sp. GP183]|uniref:IS1380 family transposase n=1 Tax=Paenibacillus sp. GP183 TaxID=1882751 RepID=UPI00089C7C53|nr:IS1380 family transposase [Paenibacillus sp. GP183]SEB87852.1 transposase, IS4 family [Paenibacillus sp. GP183]